MSQNKKEKRSQHHNRLHAKPVFVIGSARSGTSILSRLIRNYLKISFGTESQFIIRFYRRLGRYGELSNEQNLRALLADIGQERCFKRWQKWGYQIDLDRIFSRVAEKSYSGLLDAIFNDLAVHNKMDRWGDKTPEYVYDLDTLYHLFPEAKFVHILRDGRDVALSTFKMHFGAKNIGVAAMQWHHQMKCVSDFKKIIDPNQIIEFKYETFLEHPSETFMDLIKFLDIDDSDGTIRENIEKNLSEELFHGNYNKWQTELSKKEQIIYEKINYSLLKKNGYPTVTNGEETAGKIEKIFWKIDHRLKQLSRRDTWADNFYKLSIHYRDAIRKMRTL